MLEAMDGARKQHVARLMRIRRKYPTITDQIHVADLTFDFTRVAEPDAVLEEMERHADTDSPAAQPYWARAWDSAWALANVISKRPLAGTRVLDMGCGLGLTGCVAAGLGAQVTMVDAARASLLFARLNSAPWSHRVEVRQLDWRAQQLTGRRFAWILGADILYDNSDWPFLAAFWRDHLQPGGTLLLGEPGRRITDEFGPWLAQQGWQVKCDKRTFPGAAMPIRLFEAQPAQKM